MSSDKKNTSVVRPPQGGCDTTGNRTLSLLAVLMGGAMLIYGLFFSVWIIPPADAGAGDAVRITESDMIREITVGGLVRDDNGTTHKTYQQPEERPDLCPT